MPGVRVKLKEHQHGLVVWVNATLADQLTATKFLVHRAADLDDKKGIVVEFAKALFEIAPETRGVQCIPLPGACVVGRRCACCATAAASLVVGPSPLSHDAVGLVPRVYEYPDPPEPTPRLAALFRDPPEATDAAAAASAAPSRPHTVPPGKQATKSPTTTRSVPHASSAAAATVTAQAPPSRARGGGGSSKRL